MIYAFVPARAGSTRLVDKNFLILNNTRLFEWSINTANESKGVDKIIFSSDSNKLKIVFGDHELYGFTVNVPFKPD